MNCQLYNSNAIVLQSTKFFFIPFFTNNLKFSCVCALMHIFMYVVRCVCVCIVCTIYVYDITTFIRFLRFPQMHVRACMYVCKFVCICITFSYFTTHALCVFVFVAAVFIQLLHLLAICMYKCRLVCASVRVCLWRSCCFCVCN